MFRRMASQQAAMLSVPPARTIERSDAKRERSSPPSAHDTTASRPSAASHAVFTCAPPCVQSPSAACPGRVSLPADTGSAGPQVASPSQGMVRVGSLPAVNARPGGPTRTALAGGHVDCAFLTVNEAKPLVDSGDLKIVAIFAPQRLASWPNLATAREQGTDLLLNLNYWWWMPKATPRARVDRFADALRIAMNDPEVVQKYAEFNMSAVFLKGAELEAEIARQYEAMKKLAERNNVTAT